MFDPDRITRGYALLWPRALFRDELASVTELLARLDVRPGLRTLFEEAFAGPDPIEDLDRIQSSYTPDAVDAWPIDTGESVREFGRQILNHVDALPAYVPRRYYLARNAPPDEQQPSSAEVVDWAAVQQAWVAVVRDLVDRGYLDRLAGDRCTDGQGAEQQAASIAQLVEEHCGLTGRWPLRLVDEDDRPDDEEVFFTLVEVFHDLVARPRIRRWHEFDERHCWTSDFDDQAGQAVYRWRVNELLDRHGVELQLADAGDECGFLVHGPSDPRRDLVEQVRRVPDSNAGRLDHAIKLFRSRTATVEDKRSACKALADVLESRRSLLRKELLSKDEGALFHIANQYDIRHRNAQQRPDYDEAYLNWIFWWYLATVELTNRLLTRTAGAP